MSKQNKVNPGTYTQAGRLTPDDTARELKKQREAASPRQTEGGDFGEKQKSRAAQKDASAAQGDTAAADRQTQTKSAE